MKLVAFALILAAAPAAASSCTKTPVGEYRAAYQRARAYALAHAGVEGQPPCRKVIGLRAVTPLLKACGDVAGGTTHMQCRPRMTCEDIVYRLAWYCLQWQGDIPCVAVEDGGEYRMDPKLRGDWRPKAVQSQGRVLPLR